MHKAALAIAISIHPPRVGRDTPMLEQCWYSVISIHPPRVGRDRGLQYAR